MANNGYVRQSSFSDGDVIDDSLLNNEYNQLALVFDTGSGHTHDGSTGQGSSIPFIKDDTSGTKVNAGVDEVTFDIESITSLFTFVKGATGEALINGYDIDTLQADLDSKYSLSNPVDYDDITNKPATGQPIEIGDVTGLQDELDDKSDVGHTHPISDVTNLQTTLDGKALTSHTHIIADVTGLQDALDAAGGTVTKTIDAAATQTVTRVAPLTFIAITTTAARNITLNNSSFILGDIVEIDVMPTGTAGVGIITNSGTIYIQDGTNASSHILTSSSGVIKLTKISASNWRLRMYD